MAEVVLRVFAGEVSFPQSMSVVLKAVSGAKDQENLLTPRELEIIELVAKGLQNKEIAASLGIKTRTVDYHVGNILSKLGAKSRLEAVITWKNLKYS